ncbi:hypothetical protein V2J09_012124 [Rumex salicifolius]
MHTPLGTSRSPTFMSSSASLDTNAAGVYNLRASWITIVACPTIIRMLGQLITDTTLPVGVEGEKHDTPRGGHGSGVVAGEVNVLAIVYKELLGGFP